MLAPSPDWYIGCANVVLTDANSEFVATKTIRGNVYDTGTENGATFAAANIVSSTREKYQNHYPTTPWKRNRSSCVSLHYYIHKKVITNLYWVCLVLLNTH